jgi:hypothetical protein
VAFVCCIVILTCCTTLAFAQKGKSAPFPAPPASSTKPLAVKATSATASTAGTVRFSGYRWRIKNAPTPLGPGNNFFSNTAANVFVDNEGMLHLRIDKASKQDSVWRCAEVVCQVMSDSAAFGYGDYVFYTANRVDNLDRNAVFSVMISPDSARNHDAREDMMIRFTRWGQKSNVNALEYDLMPSTENADNITRAVHYPQVPFAMAGEYSTHVIRWRPDTAAFFSYHDHAFPGKWIADKWFWKPSPEANEGVPVPTKTTSVRMMLWLFTPEGAATPNAPASNAPVEVVVKKFTFLPMRDGAQAASIPQRR